jgi:hypothetical protein
MLHDDTDADTRATMLIYVVENGWWTLEPSKGVYSTEKGVPMANVTVYDFTEYHIVTDEKVHSARPATLETIAQIDNAIVLEETAQEVETSAGYRQEALKGWEYIESTGEDTQTDTSLSG